jgi:hypothetical protein
MLPEKPSLQTRRRFIAQTSAAVGALSVGLSFNTSADDKTPDMNDYTSLVKVLKEAGKPTRTFKTADGVSVLVLPYGGRVLGLFAPGSQENFYWTNTALQSLQTAREFYAGDQWKNSGGDRTWLSPEVDLFFPKFPQRDPYFQQRSLDPGNYEVVETKGGFQLVNPLTVKFSRTGEDVSLKITKGFGTARNPLRYERDLDLGGVEYAGYTQYTSLEIASQSIGTRQKVGLWNLIQMPHGGDLLIPTFSRSQPHHIFSTIGTIPSEDLLTSERLIRYRMRQKGEHKISVRAVSVCNRIGYLHGSGDQWALIVRNFVINPSGEYIDVPWTDTNDFGYAVQACNVNSNLGEFSELEYHIPAIGGDTGATRCDDAAQVWAFRGTKAKIGAICKVLLTPEPWVTGEA